MFYEAAELAEVKIVDVYLINGRDRTTNSDVKNYISFMYHISPSNFHIQPE